MPYPIVPLLLPLLLNLAIGPSLLGLPFERRGGGGMGGRALYSGGVARSPNFVICPRHFQFPHPSSKNIFYPPSSRRRDGVRCPAGLGVALLVPTYQKLEPRFVYCSSLTDTESIQQ